MIEVKAGKGRHQSANGDTVGWIGRGFVAAAALAIEISVVGGRRGDPSPVPWRLPGGVPVLLPVVRLATGGTGWPPLLSAGQPVPVMIDLLLVAVGLFALLAGRRAVSADDPDQPRWRRSAVLPDPAECPSCFLRWVRCA